jgi:dinuclear metal center YbgI/SA1388 family protein
MLVADLEAVLEGLAPRALAEPGDNVGLLVGDPEAAARRILVALELTEAVLAEAVAGGFDTVLTHHPLLFAPLSSVVESRPRERAVRDLVRRGISLIACHTNLDSAEGGIGAIAAEALGLEGAMPLQRSPAGWVKFVGFVPPDAAEGVATAVFAAGAGRIGDYDGCAFAAEGLGWFTAGPEAHPVAGELGQPGREPEFRWETVVPRSRLGSVIDAYIAAHPYEEPAFDVFTADDVRTRTGLGRKGVLPVPATVAELAGRVARTFELSTCTWAGDGAAAVRRVAVVPGSGRSLMSDAAGCDALITGDLGYHEADRAAEMGLAVINTPHGELEWWCMRRWVPALEAALTGSGVEVVTSKSWRSPWKNAAGNPAQNQLFDLTDAIAPAGPAAPVAPARAAKPAPAPEPPAPPRKLRLRVDGGSRGNPGPGGIGVVLEDMDGHVVEEFGRAIGVCTNNVAEYKALLAGLELAERAGVEELEILADSELLVKQVRGEYKVKSLGLQPLHQEAKLRLRAFKKYVIRHVPRAQNAEADRMVNKALDEAASGSL